MPRPANLPAESVSFAPTLLGRPEAQKSHDHLYWEILIKNEARQAVRQGQWKLVRYGLTSPPALFDIAADPGETTDLAAREPAVAAALAALLVSARTESPDFPLQPAAKLKKK